MTRESWRMAVDATTAERVLRRLVRRIRDDGPNTEMLRAGRALGLFRFCHFK